jgi:integrase
MDKHGEDAMNRSIKRLIGVIGDMAPKNVTRDHAAKYRDHLDQLELKPRTKQKYLEHVQTLFNVALSKRLVDANPFQGIKITKVRTKFVDEDGQEPFEAHHVRAIFDALPGEHPDFQWVTKLAAYHGMRSGEAAQLRKEDVTTTFGITVLRVHDEHGSVKNRDSVRHVPLHPSCAGFVKYAEEAEGPWIFASFPKWESTGNRLGAPYQRRASDFLRKVVGIYNPRLSMHSLRHRWITLARELGCPPEVRRAITGHALGKDEHDDYGDVPSLKLRAKWLKKIDPLK